MALSVRIPVFIAVCLFGHPSAAISQASKCDTTYIQKHNDIAAKMFSGYRFAGYKLGQKNFGNQLAYKSNDNFNIGLGVQYRFVSISFGVIAPFVNNDNDRFGKTKTYDLQSNIYLRRFTIDIFTQFYQGYYVKHSEILTAPPPNGTYVIRPDLKTLALGVNAQYIFNYSRFSYRAAFVQDEYQLKSAGSPIAGVGIHHFRISADSAIIPSKINEDGFFDNNRFNKSQVFSVTINCGYAHTVVIHKYFFITGALMGGLGYNITSLTDDVPHVKDRKGGLQYNSIIRLGAGYNANRYSAGVQYINYLSRNAAPADGSWQEFENGNFRLTFAKRFRTKRNIIDNVCEKVLPK